MKQQEFIFSSESVTEGHPDKVADQISDGVLDAIIGKDPKCRVACETLVTTGLVVVAGEITTAEQPDIQHIVRSTIRKIGYTDASMGFHSETCGVVVALDKQSPDIAMGVDEGQLKEQGAGDQGLMFGYACRETAELMPMPIQLAHRLTARLAEVRKTNRLPFLRPDGKSQVSVRYVNGKPVEITNVVISSQHSPDVPTPTLRDAIIEDVVKKVIPQEYLSGNTVFHINPTGRFVIGGPMGDCGLTGRKIIVDTYGGAGHHGGGAFSGKDPSKVDRSAAYMGRYIAKNIVAAGLADRAEVQIAYAIGVADPVSVMVDTFGTSQVDEEKLAKAVREIFPLKPAHIIRHLNLLRPVYQATASYGHFGREGDGFTWEKTDKAQALKSLF